MTRLLQMLQRVSRWFVLLVAVQMVVLFSLGSVAFGQSSLKTRPSDATEILPRWKFVAGDQLGVEIQSRENVVDDQGNAFKNERVLQLRWTVESVDAAGNARIAVRFERIQVHHQKPKVEYDSLHDSPLIGALRERADHGAVYHFRTMANCIFHFEANSRGGVLNISGAESVLVPILYTAGDMVALPEHPIRIGDTWSVAALSSGDNLSMKGQSHYRLVSLERKSGQMSCRIDGNTTATELAGRPNRGTPDTVAMQSTFDLTAGRMVSEKIICQAKVEIAPGKVYSLVSETTRRTYVLETPVEQASSPGMYSFRFDQKAAEPVILAGFRTKDVEEPITKFLAVVMFHHWSDDNKDRVPDLEEITDINTRFVAGEPANFVVYAVSIPNTKLQFEIIDANGISHGKMDLPIKGSSAYIFRAVRGLGPGIYFFEFFVDGKHLVRIPVQVVAKAESPKQPRSTDMVFGPR